jgi:4-carboxymuconolactone decarboxylase
MAGSANWRERHVSAAETFRCFAPTVEPERIAESLARRQGALGSMAFDVVGAMWSRPELSRRDRSLLVISVLAAQARDEELVLHTQNGLRNGLTREEIEEILLHVAAYAGFPAAMAASRKIDQGILAFDGSEKLPERAAAERKSDEERDRDAAGVLSTLLGRPTPLSPDEGLAWMEARLGDVGVTAYRWAFGEIWSRPQLTRRDRSIVVISILVSLGATAELAVHAPAGVRHGLSRIEVEEVVNHLSLYAGIPRAVEAIQAVRAAWARLDEANRSA